jgi:hypothetical protein
MPRLQLRYSLILLASTWAPLRAQDPAKQATVDPQYAKVTNERAEKIVAQLGIENREDSLRVRDLIAGWYRTLSALHDARDRKTLAADKAAEQQLAAHRRFIAQLETELTHEQVEQVKDGLTYGVVPLTYGVYLQMFPELTEADKREIKAQLLEAREFALDGGSSDEKHAWFGKYKGRINNYLSQAGYDLKAAEQNLRNR